MIVFNFKQTKTLKDMDFQKILLATLGGAVTLLLAGFVIWGLCLESIQSSHTIHYEGLRYEQPKMVLLAIAQVLFALLLAIIYNRWAGIKTFLSGAKAGAMIAFLVGLSHSMMMMSMLNLHGWANVAMDSVGNLLWGAIGGGVVGWILGRGQE